MPRSLEEGLLGPEPCCNGIDAAGHGQLSFLARLSQAQPLPFSRSTTRSLPKLLRKSLQESLEYPEKVQKEAKSLPKQVLMGLAMLIFLAFVACNHWDPGAIRAVAPERNTTLEVPYGIGIRQQYHELCDIFSGHFKPNNRGELEAARVEFVSFSWVSLAVLLVKVLEAASAYLNSPHSPIPAANQFTPDKDDPRLCMRMHPLNSLIRLGNLVPLAEDFPRARWHSWGRLVAQGKAEKYRELWELAEKMKEECNSLRPSAASWHPTASLKILFANAPTVNIFGNRLPLPWSFKVGVHLFMLQELVMFFSLCKRSWWGAPFYLRILRSPAEFSRWALLLSFRKDVLLLCLVQCLSMYLNWSNFRQFFRGEPPPYYELLFCVATAVAGLPFLAVHGVALALVLTAPWVVIQRADLQGRSLWTAAVCSLGLAVLAADAVARAFTQGTYFCSSSFVHLLPARKDYRLVDLLGILGSLPLLGFGSLLLLLMVVLGVLENVLPSRLRPSTYTLDLASWYKRWMLRPGSVESTDTLTELKLDGERVSSDEAEKLDEEVSIYTQLGRSSKLPELEQEVRKCVDELEVLINDAKGKRSQRGTERTALVEEGLLQLDSSEVQRLNDYALCALCERLGQLEDKHQKSLTEALARMSDHEAKAAYPALLKRTKELHAVLEVQRRRSEESRQEIGKKVQMLHERVKQQGSEGDQQLLCEIERQLLEAKQEAKQADLHRREAELQKKQLEDLREMDRMALADEVMSLRKQASANERDVAKLRECSSALERQLAEASVREEALLESVEQHRKLLKRALLLADEARDRAEATASAERSVVAEKGELQGEFERCSGPIEGELERCDGPIEDHRRQKLLDMRREHARQLAAVMELMVAKHERLAAQQELRALEREARSAKRAVAALAERRREHAETVRAIAERELRSLLTTQQATTEQIKAEKGRLQADMANMRARLDNEECELKTLQAHLAQQLAEVAAREKCAGERVAALDAGMRAMDVCQERLWKHLEQLEVWRGRQAEIVAASLREMAVEEQLE